MFFLLSKVRWNVPLKKYLPQMWKTVNLFNYNELDLTFPDKN